MSVNVVSCYEVKPRWRPSEDESDVMDRKAFRLCIDAEDCDSLLNADIWPDSVVIAEWFSKPRQYGQDEEQTKRGPLGEVVDSANEAAAAAAVGQPASANHVHQVSVSIANDSTAVGNLLARIIWTTAPTQLVMMSNPMRPTDQPKIVSYNMH